jgi:hypothetical protein
VAGKDSTLLVDGTVAPTWDWSAIPNLYSGKAGYAGMNIQVAATQAGEVAAIARSRCTAPAMTRTSSPSPA